MSGIRKLATRVWRHRPTFSTVAEIIGFVALVSGVALLSTPAALIVGGGLLILAGGFSA